MNICVSQVRCAAVFALGTFVGNSAERTDHSTTIDHNVAMMLAQLINDGSPMVRKVWPGAPRWRALRRARHSGHRLIHWSKNSTHLQVAVPWWSLPVSVPAGKHRARARTPAQTVAPTAAGAELGLLLYPPVLFQYTCYNISFTLQYKEPVDRNNTV